MVNIQNRKDSLFSADHPQKIRLQLEKQLMHDTHFLTPVLKYQPAEGQIALELLDQEKKDLYLEGSSRTLAFRPKKEIIINTLVSDKDDLPASLSEPSV